MNFFKQLKERKSEFNSFRQDAISSNLSLIKGGRDTKDDEQALYCKQPCGAQFRNEEQALYCKQPCGAQFRSTSAE